MLGNSQLTKDTDFGSGNSALLKVNKTMSAKETAKSDNYLEMDRANMGETKKVYFCGF